MLRPVYPAKDLGPAEDTCTVLMQYWRAAYMSELRGHPRLRMRHARLAVGEAERDAWLRHMREALDELQDEALDAQLELPGDGRPHSLVNVDTAPAHRGDLGLTPGVTLVTSLTGGALPAAP